MKKTGVLAIFHELIVKDPMSSFSCWIIDCQMIARFGERINNPDSIYYWAAKNKIPVFSPALTDGSIGDMLYFHTYKKQYPHPLRCDIVEDVKKINDFAMRAFPQRTGMIILGGGE